METPGVSAAMFHKGDIFCDFLSALKRCLLYKERICFLKETICMKCPSLFKMSFVELLPIMPNVECANDY